MPEMNSVPTRGKSNGQYPGPAAFSAQPPKLLDRLREALRSRHYSRRTEQTYCQWVRWFIYFHNLRHPAQMAESEINAYLTHLAVKEKVSASTQNQALSALLFLYRHVLDRKVGDLGEVIRARKPVHIPVVMTREKVRYYGLLSPRNRCLLEQIRQELTDTGTVEDEPLPSNGDSKTEFPISSLRCPLCHKGYLISIMTLPRRWRAPP
jgi:hypothetical protein